MRCLSPTTGLVLLLLRVPTFSHALPQTLPEASEKVPTSNLGSRPATQEPTVVSDQNVLVLDREDVPSSGNQESGLELELAELRALRTRLAQLAEEIDARAKWLAQIAKQTPSATVVTSTSVADCDEPRCVARGVFRKVRYAIGAILSRDADNGGGGGSDDVGLEDDDRKPGSQTKAPTETNNPSISPRRGGDGHGGDNSSTAATPQQQHGLEAVTTLEKEENDGNDGNDGNDETNLPPTFQSVVSVLLAQLNWQLSLLAIVLGCCYASMRWFRNRVVLRRLRSLLPLREPGVPVRQSMRPCDGAYDSWRSWRAPEGRGTLRPQERLVEKGESCHFCMGQEEEGNSNEKVYEDEKGLYWDEKSDRYEVEPAATDDAANDRGMVEEEEEEEDDDDDDEEPLTLGEEIASFRSALELVEGMVAAQEERIRPS
ncbi:hypothetical protein C7999DRAFT_33205 [Corynascus novoguineensis]|uniref:Uncharacterized protein n=1 Tax=Corynascus novoguineensis TaxID=1126955 RepID=A0AAN7CQF4_9PEZI|nr:hypothetical protein C7999DRAFT_33205 [Corynascus novoguineensis]